MHKILRKKTHRSHIYIAIVVPKNNILSGLSDDIFYQVDIVFFPFFKSHLASVSLSSFISK